MYSKRLEAALRLSMSAHAGQFRKADPEVPYATHPIHVAFAVCRAGGDEDTVIAALLHDLLEDTEVTAEDLEEAFGSRVTSIVREVSEDKTLPWQARKDRTIQSLCHASAEASLVAACDKIHNLETLIHAHQRIGSTVWRGFRAGPVATIRFYDDALHSLRGRISPAVEAAYGQALGSARALIPPAERET